MKKLTISMALSLIICLVFSIFSNACEVSRMTDKLIRLHVVANSDSDADQALKLAVRDEVALLCANITSACQDKASAYSALTDNLTLIKSAAESVITREGYSYPVSCSLSPTTFDRRIYDDFTLPAGEYDALCVTIGEGEGKNFWCVCYPSLCLGSVMKIDDYEQFSEDELIIVKHPEKVRYKLFCYEVIEWFRSLLK